MSDRKQSYSSNFPDEIFVTTKPHAACWYTTDDGSGDMTRYTRTDLWSGMIATNQQQAEKLRKCVEALRFYADINNHQPPLEYCEGHAVGYGPSAAYEDAGQRAREAIEFWKGLLK